MNFLIGTVMGIVLFYAHIRANPQSLETNYIYEKNLQTADLFRAWWINIMWMLSVLLAHTVLCAKPIHVIVGLRGAINSFSVLFLLESFGVKEAAATVVPQCISVLPMLMIFSAFCVEKRQSDIKDGIETLNLSRKEIATIFFVSFFAALVEATFFRLLTGVLL